MTTFTEDNHAGGFLVSEAPKTRSREAITVNSGQADLKAGTVLGRILSAAAAVAGGSNTGDGAVTVDAAIGPRTEIGTHKLVCVEAATDAGTFNYYAPSGVLIRQITVGGGAHESEQLTITIADGAADFVVGDEFTIEVSSDDYEQLDLSATTGEQVAAGILFGNVDATSADKAGAAIVRDAEVNADELVWPDGFTTAQKDAALARLAEQGIIAR